MTTPIRLLADQEVSADLKADLAAYGEHEVPFSLENSLARFQERIEGGDFGSADDSGLGHSGAEGSWAAGRAAAQLTSGKLAMVLAVGAGLGFAAFQLAKSSPEREPGQGDESAPALVAPRPPEQEDPSLEETGDPEPAEVSPLETGNAEESEKLPAPASQPGRKQTAAAPREVVDAVEPQRETPSEKPSTSSQEPTSEPTPGQAVQGSDALKREIAQLSEIRRALASNPRRSLELAERGHREFRDGSFFQEREALALRALHALKDRDALEIRGQAFLLRYPKSSFAGEIERMIAE